MKNKLLFLTVTMLALAVVSCRKEENRIFLEGGTAPTLTSSRTGTLPMSFATQDQQILTLNWTNPDYHFTTGVSSQDVTYTIEFDTTGANFTNPKKQQVTVARETTRTFTVGQINDYMLNQLMLDSTKTHNIEVRVVSSIGGAAPLYSNVIKFTNVKPYAIPPKVDPPTNETLWVVGNAFLSPDWANPIPAPYDVVHRFTKVSKTLYELTVQMKGGGNYKLIQENGVWGTQYHKTTGTWEGGEFEKKDADPGFDGAPTAGTYKITVNFQTGKYTVVKL